MSHSTATDKAGNSSQVSATYDVLAWTLSDFYQPVDMSPATGPIVLNTVKGGSTVPMKFEIFVGATELTDVSSSGLAMSVVPVDCNTSSSIVVALEDTTTGATALRYDTTAGQFIFNWKTPKMPGSCYKVTAASLDGSSISAYFKLK